jgi:hypothetical protein
MRARLVVLEAQGLRKARSAGILVGSMKLLTQSLLALTLGLLIASCHKDTSEQASKNALSEAEAEQMLINRNWMDLWPASETEKLHVFRFVPTMGGGVFQDRTLFQGTFELFTYRVDKGQIRFHLHHEKQRVDTNFRIENVEGPKPFDLKLTLDDSPRGPHVYYGRRAESVNDLGMHPLK